MSSSRPSRRAVLAGFAGFSAALLSACTMRPLYAEGGAAEARLALNYAAPKTRLEQIVYQELRRRLGDADPGAPLATVTVNTSSRRLAISRSTSPMVQYEMTASGRIIVTRDGKTIASILRSASASYQGESQGLPAAEARAEAEERAALALADQLRLALVAALAR